MAQYLLSVLADTSDLATAEETAAIDAFNERLAALGSKHCNRKVELRPFLGE